MRRKRKTGAAKRRRIKDHQKRLIALGVPAEKVAKLNTKQVRLLIRRPVKTAKRAKSI